MILWLLLGTCFGLVAALPVAVAAAFLLLLYRIYGSIQPVAGAPADSKTNPLSTHLHALRSLAWAPLTTTTPTPVHKARVGSSTFYIKREDLISRVYSGNKVRTLQYQLSACQAHLARHPNAHFYVLGSYGSNMTAATASHASEQLKRALTVCLVKKDAPDLFNTLNMLSCLSLCERVILSGWLGKVCRAVMLPWSHDKVFSLGGNSVAGVLGQVNAVLELAEQICRKECPDPDAIYLPVGSACTVTVRMHPAFRGEPVFKSQRLKIVAVPASPIFAGLHRRFGYFTSYWSRLFAVSPMSGIVNTCALFQRLGVREVSVPALRAASISFLQSNVEFVTEDDLISPYGAHSPRSTKAAKKADEDLEVEGPLPWICGHFVAKPWSVMMDRLGQGYADGESVLFWLTKSLVQPVDQDGDELARLRKLAAATPGLDEWTTGSASSRRRQGKVDIVGGKAADYRHLMTYRDKGE